MLCKRKLQRFNNACCETYEISKDRFGFFKEEILEQTIPQWRKRNKIPEEVIVNMSQVSLTAKVIEIDGVLHIQEGIAEIPALFSVIDDGFIRLRFSFLAASNFLRCGSAKSVAEGKIPRFKVLSWHRRGSVWLRACHQRAFRIGKRQPLHCFLRNADGTTQVDSRIDRLARSSRVTPPGCLYPSRWLPWLRRCAQRTQVCLKLMIIRVNLQFLYRRPNQYKRKLSEWDIYLRSRRKKASYIQRICLHNQRIKRVFFSSSVQLIFIIWLNNDGLDYNLVCNSRSAKEVYNHEIISTLDGDQCFCHFDAFTLVQTSDVVKSNFVDNLKRNPQDNPEKVQTLVKEQFRELISMPDSKHFLKLMRNLLLLSLSNKKCGYIRMFVYVLDPRKVAACTSILRIQRPETAFFELYTAQIRFHALLRGSGCAKRLEGRGGAASPFIASISNFRLLFAAIFAVSIHLDSQNVSSI
ncbi:Hypothetical_protein [Hexamita inflata]|uniref:Hypothetical_protein n=1 Tax=Hexamita inflata TaxID=28002 RepID=A0AA86UFG8_9EUKA|nr:Hypothetical protein HINF_LOCUS41459 [Hexamita inflata]